MTSFLSKNVDATEEPDIDSTAVTQEPAVDPPNLDTQDDVQDVATPQELATN